MLVNQWNQNHLQCQLQSFMPRRANRLGSFSAPKPICPAPYGRAMQGERNAVQVPVLGFHIARRFVWLAVGIVLFGVFWTHGWHLIAGRIETHLPDILAAIGRGRRTGRVCQCRGQGLPVPLRTVSATVWDYRNGGPD
jgi:hypothetical protein